MASTKKASAEDQIESLTKKIKQCYLVEHEIQVLPEDVRVYKSVGKMFQLQTQVDMKKELKENQEMYKDKIKNLENQWFMPPPPPPPPEIKPLVASLKPEKEKGGTVLDNVLTSCSAESLNAINMFLHLRGLAEKDVVKGNYIFVSSFHPVVPVIQSGPLCGMVALAMASDLAGGRRVSTEEILKHAQGTGVSKQGEVFSAQYMCDMASHFLPCQCHVEDVSDEKQDIIRTLARGDIILIPYDSDKNKTPCKKKGHKAHWALLNGFFLVLTKHSSPPWLKAVCSPDSDFSNLLYWPDQHNSHLKINNQETLTSMCNDLSHLCETADSVYVFGQEGKTRRTGLWPLSELVTSNMNLEEAGPERRGFEEYVLPNDSIQLTELCSKMVVIQRNAGAQNMQDL